jgi:hypothetical protein
LRGKRENEDERSIKEREEGERWVRVRKKEKRIEKTKEKGGVGKSQRLGLRFTNSKSPYYQSVI